MSRLANVAKLIALVCLMVFTVAAHAVTLTVSPGSVDANYLGNIDATIVPEAPGGVRLQLVIDFNNNGSADASEPVVHEIELAD